MIFCVIVSLSGPILGREALGWFVDMSAIGASIGYFFTSAATLVTLRRDKDGTGFLKAMATTGVVFSVIFMILQLIPIPGLSGVHWIIKPAPALFMPSDNTPSHRHRPATPSPVPTAVSVPSVPKPPVGIPPAGIQ